MILPIQVRAARALLGLGQEQLAQIASVSVMTVKRFETAGSDVRGTISTLSRVQTALEKLGIEFIDQTDEHGPGVRLRHPVK